MKDRDMSSYRHILVALELDPASDNHIVHKVKLLKQQYDAGVTLVHAIENLANYGAAYGVMAGVDIEEELLKEAEKVMAELSTELGVDKKHQIVKVGPAKQIILDEAKSVGADLIVVGSHGRHGVRLLLGSTANAVLHSANCDVLAVRVQD